ncbi:hypothetical protein ACFL6M_00305 [Candidatus Eisenbacteria bacterium]|uniref:STAS/SEC14 domain-containing protein n=1 Tax=Eiseniibacteriota bacterium TaxID=2212470 RepID=A0ABV6YI60_UNCEI
MTSETLSILNKGTYLLVEFFGEFSVEAGKQCVDRMAEACEKHRLREVLLDCRRMTGNMPLFDRFQVAEYGATKRRLIGRLALLNRDEVVLPDNFVENVSVNRGMAMKIFTNFDEAEHWLSRSAPNKLDTGDGS